MLAQFDVDSGVALEGLEQPFAAPGVTSVPVRPGQLLPLLLRKLVGRIPIEERILVVEDAEADGFDQSEASDRSDEEVTGGRDRLVADPSYSEERCEVVQESEPTSPTRGTRRFERVRR